MKFRVLVFLSIASFVLLLAPAINITGGERLFSHKSDELFNREGLYNVDFVVSQASRILYPIGVSVSPKEALIGKSGWLFLGDFYQNSVSLRRFPASSAAEAEAAYIADTATAWRDWLRARGVQEYRILIGPDKSSIYPEFIPDWAAPVAYTVTDALIKKSTNGIYLDARPALLSAKSHYPYSLYYKTDTHWNRLGARAAFDTLARSVGVSHEELKWPSPLRTSQIKQVVIAGGDISKFLRLKEYLTDDEIIIKGEQKTSQIEVYNYDTKDLIYSGKNKRLRVNKFPSLVLSPDALNDKKVLWLRDSFGRSMSEYMAQTFTTVLQRHFGEVDATLFAKMVEEFKPDYVFITTVERSAQYELFKQRPLGPG